MQRVRTGVWAIAIAGCAGWVVFLVGAAMSDGWVSWNEAGLDAIALLFLAAWVGLKPCN